MIKIGVFDSGIGGLSVAKAIEHELPQAQVLYLNDTEHLPYGTKTLAQIKEYSWPKIKQLADSKCDCIVIACNTLSTNYLKDLQQTFAPTPVVGIVPMIKPASKITNTKIIGVCATPRTLQSPRYAELKEQYTKDITVIEPDCSNWASMIESNQLDKQHIKKTINELTETGADVIVLGCTHYHWISDLVKQYAGLNVEVIQPEHAIVNRIKSVLYIKAVN